LDNNVILVTAPKRGLIAIPMDQIKMIPKETYGGSTYEIPTPHGVKLLKVGSSTHQVVTVKEKSIAYVLGTDNNNNSILAEVKWNAQTADLEIVKMHNVNGDYEKIFIEN